MGEPFVGAVVQSYLDVCAPSVGQEEFEDHLVAGIAMEFEFAYVVSIEGMDVV